MLAYEKVDKVMTREQLLADGTDKFCDEISRGRNELLETAHVVCDVRHNWLDAYRKLEGHVRDIDDEPDQKKALDIVYAEIKGAIDKLYVYDQRDYVMMLLETVYENMNNKISGNAKSLWVSCDFVGELKEKLDAIEEEEYNEILWSGECKFKISLKDTFWQEDKQLYEEKVSELKADRERKYISSESRLFWGRIISKEMLNLLDHADQQGYFMLKEFFAQAARQLQTLILREDDFRENPIHCLLGSTYDPNEVSKHVGTRLVEAVEEFGFYIRDDRIYQAQEELENVLKLEPELEKIADDTVRDLTAEFLARLHGNLGVIGRVFGVVDNALKAYFIPQFQ